MNIKETFNLSSSNRAYVEKKLSRYTDNLKISKERDEFILSTIVLEQKVEVKAENFMQAVELLKDKLKVFTNKKQHKLQSKKLKEAFASSLKRNNSDDKTEEADFELELQTEN